MGTSGPVTGFPLPLYQSLVQSVQAQDYCESIHIYVFVVLMLFLECLYRVHGYWYLEILYTDVLIHRGYIKK
jgi:hypothetical protein